MTDSIAYSPPLITEAIAESIGGASHASGAKHFNPGLSNTSTTKKTPYTIQQERLQWDRIWDFLMPLRAEKVAAGGLVIAVTPGVYRKTDGTDVTYAGTTSFTLDDDTVNKVYIDVSSNAVAKASSWPVDRTSFVPIADVTTASGAITDITDASGLLRLWIPPTAAAISGTDATQFVIDQDNASTGVDVSIAFNRGSSGNDATLLWDHSETRFEITTDGSTLAGINCGGVLISGVSTITSGGKLAIAAIDSSLVYEFAAGGLKIEPNGSSGAPASGTHADGELYFDSNHVLWVCTADGTPGTWKRAGDLSISGVFQVSIGDSSGASPRTVDVQVKDRAGNNVAEEVYLQIGVYEDAEGADVATNATITDVPTGTEIANGQHEGSVESTKKKIVKTNSSGLVQIEVTNGTAETVYLLAEPAPRSACLDCRDIGTVVTS